MAELKTRKMTYPNQMVMAAKPKPQKQVTYTLRKSPSKGSRGLELTFKALCLNHYAKRTPPFSFPTFKYLYYVHNPSEAIVWLLKFEGKTVKERFTLYLKLLTKIQQTKTPARCAGTYRLLKGKIIRTFLHNLKTLALELKGRQGKIPEWSAYVRYILQKTGGAAYFTQMSEFGKWYQH